MTDILTVRNLAKQYSDLRAVDGVSFHVRPGEIVGLLGPNGAGKTTSINMILGVLDATSGEILIDGINLAKQPSQAKSRTNFAAVYAPLPGNLTVWQNLRIFAMLYGVTDYRARIESLMETYHLTRFRDTKSGLLSSGEQTRVALAKAMLNSPALLLLDEPTASVDPASARSIREHIRAFASEGTSGVLWTSHNMAEVESVCDRVLLMSRGRILLEGDPKTLPQHHGKASLEELFLTVADEPLELENA